MRRLAVAFALLGLVAGGCGEEPQTAPRIVATIEVGRIMAIATGPEGIWTVNYEDGTVSLVDPDNNEVVEELEVTDKLGSGASDIHVVDGHVWLVAADSHTIGHLDPSTLEVSMAANVGPAGIIDVAASQDDLWLAHQSDMKTGVPQTAHGTEIRSANLEVPPPGQQYAIYSDIAAGDAGVWAIDESQGTLAAISTPSGSPHIVGTGEPAFMGAQADVAVGHGSVWVEGSDNATSRLTRFDPETEEIDTITLEGEDGVMAMGDEAVWVLTHSDEQALLWRIDPGSFSTPSDPFELSGEYSSADLAYGSGSVWVSHNTNLLTRIDVSGSVPVDETVPSPEIRGDADVCDQNGPWSYCPEARWLRRVIVESGFEVTADTGTAWEFTADERDLYAWNTDAAAPVEKVAADEGYEPIEGTEASTDGVRILWEAQGLHIYLSSAGESGVDDVPVAVIETLIAASLDVPMGVDRTGAMPQPTPTGEQRFEQTEDGKVRVWPVTEDVEDDGTYLFAAPHCGLDWMMDFDASFWRPEKPDDYGNGDNYPFFYNSDEGRITFSGHDSAIYQASTGEQIRLTRLEGPIVIDPCA